MTPSTRRAAARWLAVGALVVSAAAAGTAPPAQAAKNDGCTGSGFSLVNLSTGAVVARAGAERIRTTIPAAQFGSQFGVRGRYAQFDVRASDFAVFNQAFTAAPSELSMTGGRLATVFASKVPDLKGAVLSSAVSVELRDDSVQLTRTGTGVSMKIQAKDCAQGGIFQMEPSRTDGGTTRITHTLAAESFFFDNPNFRARVGQYLGADCTSVTTGPPSQFCVRVTTRVNIANSLSPRLVARDSAQVATRVSQPQCNTATPVTPSAAHCGGVSIWDVASGGRMGFVTGEDSTEVANPPTTCVSDCQAQNQVRGRLANLGFPSPVPAGSRLTPRS